MSCTICGYGFPIADGDAVTLDFEKAKEFLKKHVGSFGQTDEEMQILDALEHAESEDAEEDELEDVMYDIEESFEDEETGDTGFGAVLAVIMRRETGINFKFYAAENDLGTPPAILWIPMYPWMLNEKEIQKLEEEAEIHLAAIYKEYCRQLREQQLMDYDDQMVYAYNMLRKIPELLAYFQEKYPYICVDEAQDTSKIQHAIIALLASKSENLFMVGDEDQSIYGFRAAYPEALLEFEQRHRGAKVLLMEENFRSDANIVAAADYFIQKNTLRHEKHMRASRESVQQIKEIPVGTRKAQYAYLAKVAEGCTTETAVLYREHECALPLIDLLERKGIPYRMRNAELTFLLIEWCRISAISSDLRRILRIQNSFCRCIISSIPISADNWCRKS